MIYGDLFFIKSCDSLVIGIYICTRPNGNIIYDRYIVSEKLDFDNLCENVYRYKINKIDIGELNKSDEKDKFIDVCEIEVFFDKKIKKLNHDIKENKNEIDTTIIDKLQNSINLLNDEIENTIMKPIDESLSKEERNIFWNNKNKSIAEKQKGIKRLEKRLEGLKLKNEVINNDLEKSIKEI